MKAKQRLAIVLNKIHSIEILIDEFEGKISLALEDEVKTKPAILMHMIAIAEQINKLKNDNEFEILEKFSKDDLKGLSDVRNFIAHDYEGVDMYIIETAVRFGLPSLKKSIKKAYGK